MAKREPSSVEDAEDIMLDIELAALQIEASAKSEIKLLEKALKKVEKYLKENAE